MSRTKRHTTVSPTSTLKTVQNSTLGLLTSLVLAMLYTPNVVQAEDLNPPPPAPTETAESIAPPPPQPPTDPLAPAQLTKRIRVEYMTVVYPAFVSWLGTSNGLPNTASTFGMFLTFQAVTPHQRYCYMRCYLEMHG